MSIVQKLVFLWRVIQKGWKVIRRDGLKKGVELGYKFFRHYIESKIITPIDTAVLDMKGIPYRRSMSKVSFGLRPFPFVSVIIPVFNGWDYVKECIDSLYSSKCKYTFEIIVIDQHSSDGVLNVLKNYAKNDDRFILIENPKNMGFAHAMNQGARIAKGKYLVLANSDLVFTPGWIDPLVELAENNPEVGVVSPMTNYVGEGPQIDVAATSLHAHEASDYAHAICNRSKIIPAIDRLVFFCVLISKSVYDLLGGLANVYALGNYEDDDFCLRARLAGYKLMIVSSSFVYHHGSKTFTRQKINYKDLMAKNEKLFFQRVTDFSLGSHLRHKNTEGRDKISVILRTKNRPALLKLALTSLLNQTYNNVEVIIVNDGDPGLETLLKPFHLSLDIRLVEGFNNLGRAKALNQGLEAASGDLITYLDDDDLLYPFHLEYIVKGWQDHPDASLIYTDVNKSLCWIDGNREHIVTLARDHFQQKDFDYDELLVFNWIPNLSYSHRRSDAERIGGYDEGFEIYEDWDFLLRLTKAQKAYRIPRITCEYRLHFSEGQVDNTLFERYRALDFLKKLFDQHPVSDRVLTEKRQELLKNLDLQIETITMLNQFSVSSIQKRFLLAATLGSFEKEKNIMKVALE